MDSTNLVAWSTCCYLVEKHWTSFLESHKTFVPTTLQFGVECYDGRQHTATSAVPELIPQNEMLRYLQFKSVPFHTIDCSYPRVRYIRNYIRYSVTLFSLNFFYNTRFVIIHSMYFLWYYNVINIIQLPRNCDHSKSCLGHAACICSIICYFLRPLFTLYSFPVQHHPVTITLLVPLTTTFPCSNNIWLLNDRFLLFCSYISSYLFFAPLVFYSSV